MCWDIFSLSSAISISRALITFFLRCGAHTSGHVTPSPAIRRLCLSASLGGDFFFLRMLMTGIGWRPSTILDSLLMKVAAGLRAREGEGPPSEAGTAQRTHSAPAAAGVEPREGRHHGHSIRRHEQGNSRCLRLGSGQRQQSMGSKGHVKRARPAQYAWLHGSNVNWTVQLITRPRKIHHRWASSVQTEGPTVEASPEEGPVPRDNP